MTTAEPLIAATDGPTEPLHLVPAHTADRRRSLFRQLGLLGWERMSSAFALPVGGDLADYRGIPVPPSAAFSTERRGTSALSSRSFTLRTLDLDFELVGRNRLRRAGVNQKLYSLGYALHERSLLADVLLAEGWIRARDFYEEPIVRVLEEHFHRVDKRIERIDHTLVRYRLNAWEPRDAH
ncbi:hypothetical protein [Streptomyces sasae]|uniref:hypothetical protein n=1 Tax=Streptomyces sasae TaxID=1266772 RepID=UPI00292F1472|nr:hypothetical protein [Streptomyces sasae]